PLQDPVRVAAVTAAALDMHGPFCRDCVVEVISVRWHSDYGGHRNDRGAGVLSAGGGIPTDWGCRTRIAKGGGMGTGDCSRPGVTDGASAPGGRLGDASSADTGRS